MLTLVEVVVRNIIVPLAIGCFLMIELIKWIFRVVEARIDAKAEACQYRVKRGLASTLSLRRYPKPPAKPNPKERGCPPKQPCSFPVLIRHQLTPYLWNMPLAVDAPPQAIRFLVSAETRKFPQFDLGLTIFRQT